MNKFLMVVIILMLGLGYPFFKGLYCSGIRYQNGIYMSTLLLMSENCESCLKIVEEARREVKAGYCYE